MYRQSLKNLLAKITNKEISCKELVQYFLARSQKFQPQLNSYITLTEEIALQAATYADDKLARGERLPLHGLPIVHKDIFCTQGVKTSCGSKMLDQFIAPYNATVVSQLNEAGMVMLGKANMDEFAMGSSNENSFYGPVANPWDLARVPGGSSGGSAAIVAAGLAVAATGTDTGGSIRQPAALCGISGIKPTYGRVSRYGMVAYASSLDQGGPMAHSAADLALLLQYMAGFDAKDSTSAKMPVPDYCATLNTSLRGLKIGLPKEYFGEGLDRNVGDVILNAVDALKKLGADICEVSLPSTHLAIPAYYIIAPAECSSNLSRYDGVRYGYRCKDPESLEDLYKRSRSEAFGAEVTRRILIGTYALSSGYYDAYYLKAQKIRRLIRDDFLRVLSEVDVILGPTTPTTAFKQGEKTSNPLQMYLSDIYTIAVNLAGLPALSIPAGFVAGLPVGLQMIGKHFDEARLLNVAHQYQEVTDWHLKWPAGF